MVPYSCLMNANESDGGHYVELLEAKFFGLLRHVLAQVDVDEDWYLASYNDVAEAVRTGSLKSARTHYVRAGYFAGGTRGMAAAQRGTFHGGSRLVQQPETGPAPDPVLS